MMDRLPARIGNVLRDLKSALESIYGPRLHGIYLYGSYARGEAGDESDVDVFVVLEGPVKTGAEISRINAAVSEICLTNDLLISTFPIAADSFAAGQSPFLIQARKEAVAV